MQGTELRRVFDELIDAMSVVASRYVMAREAGLNHTTIFRITADPQRIPSARTVRALMKAHRALLGRDFEIERAG